MAMSAVSIGDHVIEINGANYEESSAMEIVLAFGLGTDHVVMLLGDPSPVDAPMLHRGGAAEVGAYTLSFQDAHPAYHRK
jgi:hypothetical protein